VQAYLYLYSMPAGQFFAYAAEVLKPQPPHLTHQPILALMRRIGVERGNSFSIENTEPVVKQAPQSVCRRKPGS